jgi:hypothetical protein
MSTVTMEYSERVALDTQIETQKQEIQYLKDNAQQVMIYHKYFNGKIKPNSKRDGSYIEVTGVHGGDWNRRSFSESSTISNALNRGWIDIDLTEDSTRTTKDYKNLSEVQEEIRAEEYAKVQVILGEALDRATKSEYDSSKIEDRYKKIVAENSELNDIKLKELKETHINEIAANEKQFNKLIGDEIANFVTLKQEFDDFKADKKRLTLEQQIATLMAELKAEREKSFFKKLFK